MASNSRSLKALVGSRPAPAVRAGVNLIRVGVVRDSQIRLKWPVAEGFSSPAGSGAGATQNTSLTQALTGGTTGTLNLG